MRIYVGPTDSLKVRSGRRVPELYLALYLALRFDARANRLSLPRPQ